MRDIACDLYPEGLNLKQAVEIEWGVGVHWNFDNDTQFSSNFTSNFLRKNDNKRVFYPYLVDKILEKAYYKEKITVVTKKNKKM